MDIISPQKNKNSKISFEDSFNSFIENNINNNELVKIEEKQEDNFLRVMTFNVHSYKDFNNNEINIDDFINIIHKIKADIICLQEVIYRHKITEELIKLFENNFVFCNGDYDGFGNLLLSKYDFLDEPYIKEYKDDDLFFIENKKRCYISVKINYEGKIIKIICLHIENTKYYKKIRQLKDIISNNDENDIILLGDFNIRNLQELLDNNQLKFIHTYKNMPYLTSLYHHVVDYIIIKKCMKDIQLLNTYIYYTKLSDHLPVISDFILQEQECINTKINYIVKRYQPNYNNYKYFVKDVKNVRILPKNDVEVKLESDIDMNKINIIDGIKIYKYNKNTDGPMFLYKGMEDPIVLLKNDDINNSFAQNDVWYSSKSIASYYMINKYHKIYKYEVLTDLNLFILMDYDNIKILIDKLKEKLRIFIDKFSKNYNINEYINDDILITSKNIINNFKHEYYELSNLAQIKKIYNYIQKVKIATGFDMSWNEQYDAIIEILNVDISQTRKITNDRYFSDKKNNTIIFNINNNLFSHKKEHLNRASLTLNTDKVLTEAIKYIFNVDGYISYSVPSLYHRYGIFHNEICIFNSRHIIDLNSFKPEIPDLDLYDYPYNNQLFSQIYDLKNNVGDIMFLKEQEEKYLEDEEKEKFIGGNNYYKKYLKYKNKYNKLKNNKLI